METHPQHEWRERLEVARRSLREEPGSAYAWLLRVRVRVLEFLVRRYEPVEVGREEPPLTPRQVKRLRPVYACVCVAEASDQHPPKSRDVMHGKLASIRVAREVGAVWSWCRGRFREG